MLSAIAVLLGAALLFVLEPMFARMVLPLLGGTPAVWNTVLVFFQVALFAGYAYAHLSATRLTPRAQVVLHLLLVAAVFGFLPIAVPAGTQPPTGGNPVPWLLGRLAVIVGLPFFVVSATGPLIQRWFHVGARGRDPYVLYAASNIGSIGGLLAYPFVLEPHLGLATQSRLWEWGFALLGVVLAACAWSLWRAARPGEGAAPAQREPEAGTSGAGADVAAIGPRQRFRWLLLAFVPSSLMMGVTMHISTDVAAIPLLWVVPLALYLLTFVIVFARRPLVSVHWSSLLTLGLSIPLLLVYVAQRPELPLNLAANLVFFFVAALMCHGQLAAERPDPRHLTEFYLWIAAGGALGGVFNALLAPVWFRSVAEYPIAIVLACALIPGADTRPERPARRVRDVLLPLLVGLIAWGVVRAFVALGVDFVRPLQVALLAVLLLPVYSFSRRPLRFALGVAALFIANPAALEQNARLLSSGRSFFGVVRVLSDGHGHLHELYHGTTLHGIQRTGPSGCRTPLGYYGRTGPLGDLFTAARARRTPLRVGVAGLGAGGSLAYAEPGDRWAVYEIDPLIVHVARDTALFCFMAASPAPTQIVLGDARLSLAHRGDAYDLLLLDAYSSDAIPVHLLTREALRTYLARLAPGGVIAYHVSNRYFDLAPIVARLAADAGLACRVREHGQLTPAQVNAGMWPSIYVAVARRPEDLAGLAAPAWAPAVAHARTPLWTDDFSSLFAALR